MYSQGKNLQFNLSGVGCWLTVIGVVWLLGAVGLGWLVKSIAVLFVLLLITPVIAFFGFQWWLRRNLVEGPCPVCEVPLASLRDRNTTCLNCGTPLVTTADGFRRNTPEGTVEVSAVDITNDDPGDTVISVEVLPPVEED